VAISLLGTTHTTTVICYGPASVHHMLVLYRNRQIHRQVFNAVWQWFSIWSAGTPRGARFSSWGCSEKVKKN